MIENELPSAIAERISEALSWCLHLELSGKPFRSPELNPAAILAMPRFPDDRQSIEVWVKKRRDSYVRAVSWIRETRSAILKTINIEPIEVSAALSKSRLLIYEPLETVEDGAAEASSMGFYDLHDAPPWDMWFLSANHAVFCCVPDSAIPRAQIGIDSVPVDCIRWADWSKLAEIG